jgi:putative transposase
MGRPIGPKKVHRYSVEFKLTAVKLSGVPGCSRCRQWADNAHMESFFHSMKTDVAHGVRVEREEDLVRLLRSYILYYNGARLHSGLDYHAPVAYEALTR